MFQFWYYFSFQETPSIFPDRVIAVRGTVEHMSAAEAIISSKLRECYERDQKNMGTVRCDVYWLCTVMLL